MKALILALTIALLTGCASVKQSSQTAVAADVATTVAGVGSGLAAEANPLITSPATLLLSAGIRLYVINEIDKQPEPQRTESLSVFNSVTWGIAASNLAVIALASNPAGLVAGLIAGVSVWNSTEDKRLFAQSCAYMRQIDPTIKCVFKS